MKLGGLSLACMALLLVAVDAQTTVAPGAKKPCLSSGGVAIQLNGNFGFCYLKGRRMRRGSVFAQCSDGHLTCFQDEGIPDKPRTRVTCIAPEPGNCGSDANATPTNGTRSAEVAVGEEEDGELDVEPREAHSHTVNPSALVAGNLPSGETYDEDEEEEDDSVYR